MSVVTGIVAGQPLLQVLAETVAVARAAERGDLVGRLETLAGRIRDPRRRIVVAGLGNQGKSRFVNALISAEVCAVGDDTTTTVTTVLAHADEPRATLVLAAPDGGEPTRIIVPFGEVGGVAGRTPEIPDADAAKPFDADRRFERELATGPGGADRPADSGRPAAVAAGGRRVVRVEVQTPNRLLADGVVVVDTPGLGMHGGGGTASILGTSPAADAVLLITDASTELTDPEMDFLRQARELCPAVAVLVTKIDLYPHWRQVLEADRIHLSHARIDVPLIPVSSVLRSHAVRLQDQELGRESGFGAVFEFLREQVVARDQREVRRAAAVDITSAAEHLALAIGSELVALRDPEQGAAAVRELGAAKNVAEHLHRRTSGWQQTLGDGVTDLAGDIDHDLRERLRTIARTAEEWIDEQDPGRHWGQVEEWLTATIEAAIGDNLLWTRTRATLLAERVGAHFTELGAVDLPDVLETLNGDESRSGACTLADLEPGLGFGDKILVGVRGSYGGVIMAGMAGTMAGLALINPLSLGAGVILGGKAFRDDKKARLAKRRSDAKLAVRRYLDDVAFHTGKETKDRLHRIHRLLRDHFTAVADRTLRSLDDSLRAAQEAATLESAQRATRCTELERRLRVVAELRHHAAALLEPPVTPALPPTSMS
ncbi:dynamin family protein [Nocardia jejuensis]|uniref:dynamin family protein n=1 Tax=Nocardia jejuensis TaxID=328049 RepID=UPI0008377813|nr:dynamin family protein [Nocardia jejuensis]